MPNILICGETYVIEHRAPPCHLSGGRWEPPRRGGAARGAFPDKIQGASLNHDISSRKEAYNYDSYKAKAACGRTLTDTPFICPIGCQLWPNCFYNLISRPQK